MNKTGLTKCWLGAVALTGLLTAGAVWAEDDRRVYRWQDDAGNVHYGDRVPAEFAANGHAVLNEYGVEIETVTGKMTAEELAAMRAEAEAQAQARAAAAESRLRDKVLLSTYLSVEEIEALRDSRIELLDGQIRLTQRYLDNLRAKIVKLEKEAQQYSPYSAEPGAKPIDENLARELSDTLNSILLYEKNMSKSLEEQRQIKKKFASDIRRFNELQLLSQNR
jgi:hypothetical protein